MKIERKTLITAALLGFVGVTAVTLAVKETRYNRAVAVAEAARAEKAQAATQASSPAPPAVAVAEPTPVPTSAPVATPQAVKPPKATHSSAPATAVAAVAEVQSPQPQPGAASTIVVSYFHTTARCASCLRIEDLTAHTVTTRFGVALAGKRLVWRTVNIDEPENAHFAKDYSLHTKSVVVSEMKDGREVRWKNLDQVWPLLRDQEAFTQYVEKEIKAFLEPA